MDDDFDAIFVVILFFLIVDILENQSGEIENKNKERLKDMNSNIK